MNALSLQHLGRVDCARTLIAMQDFVHQRRADADEALWLCEHDPVFTLGQAGQTEHVLQPGNIPVIPSNRGGQVTYHGPGQIVAYPLIHLQRRGWYAKEYVHRLEEAVLRTLAHWGVTGHRVAGAPGIYVRPDRPFDHARLPQRPGPRRSGSPPSAPDFSDLAQVAAVGIKISRHWCSHGVALNVAMNLQPCERINPCGHAGLRVVDLSTLLGTLVQPTAVAQELARHLHHLLTA